MAKFPSITTNIITTFTGIQSAPDNICGIISSASVVGDTFLLDTTYTIRNLDELEDTYGVTEDNNPTLYRLVSQYYSGTGGDAELRIWGTALASLDAICDTSSTGGVKDFLNDNGGAIKLVTMGRDYPDGYGITGESAFVPTPDDIDADYDSAQDKLQITLATLEGNSRWAIGILPCPYVDPTALDDDNSPNAQSNFLVVPCVANDGYDAVKGVVTNIQGIILGYAQSVGVSRSIAARTRGGVLGVSDYYLGRGIASDGDDSAARNVINAGFLGLYKLTGDGNFYLSGEPTAVTPSSSRRNISSNRALIKASGTARDSVAIYLNGNYNETPTGGLDPSVVGAIEGDVISSLRSNIGGDVASFTFSITDSSNFRITESISGRLTIHPFRALKAITIDISFSL